MNVEDNEYKPSSLKDEDIVEYVTFYVDDQLFGFPILNIQDVFIPEQITAVPMSDKVIAGVLNLRGKIVTAINLRAVLGIELVDNDENNPRMAIGVDYKMESYGLLIDRIGEVLRLKKTDLEPTPANMNKIWDQISSGVHKLDGVIMVVIDVKKLIEGHIYKNVA